MVEAQLDITNISTRKYPDDEVCNILFSVMSTDKLNNYKPLQNTKTFITDPIFFKHQDETCQTNYIDFTSDKCEQVSKEQLIPQYDVIIQTDEIQHEQKETANMYVQTEDVIPVIDHDINNTTSDETISCIKNEIKCVDSPNDEVILHKESKSDTCTDVQVTLYEDTPGKSKSFGYTGDASETVTNIEQITQTEDSLCNFSVDNLFTETCYNKNIDKNIIISTEQTYEEHSHRNVIIENSKQVCYINLYNGRENEQKDFYLYNPSAYHAIINTTMGSFCIDSHNIHKKVLYSDEWITLDTAHNNLFPTHINNKMRNDTEFSSFGSSIATNGIGNICVVGGITARESIGSAYIYSCVNGIWTICEELLCNDNIGCSFFGSSVSIDYSGNTIAIGGSGDNNCTGACWIYQRTTQSSWNNTKKIIGSTEKLYHGINVHLTPDGKKLFICGTGNSFGIVNVFDYVDNDWIESQKINVPNSNHFGMFISTDHVGSCVVIGSLDNTYIFDYKNKYELVSTLFKNNTVNQISMNQNCSSIIASILQYDKNTDIYVIERDHKNNWSASHKLFTECSIKFNELYCCGTSANGETLIVSGIDENNYSVVWCFTKINNKWCMLNKQILSETVTNEIVSDISSFGHTTVIGLPQIDNYNGECIILS